MILDVKQALAAYTSARQEHLATVSALGAGAAAMAGSGAAIAGVGAVIVGAFTAAVNKAAEFEKRLSFFKAVANATAEDLDIVREKALQLGADTIYSANQIAESFIELGKAGVKAQDIVDGIGEAVANLGAASDIPLTEAAQSLIVVLNTFGIAATDAVRVVDTLTGAANASNIEVGDLINTLTYVGAVAKTSGISLEDISGAIAVLGQNGIVASKAGTGLRQMLTKLIAPTNSGTNALIDLGIASEDGSSKLKNLDGTLKPIPEIIDVLSGALEGMNVSERMDILGQIFPITSLPTIMSLLNSGSSALHAMNAEIAGISAADVAEERLNNLAGDVEKLSGNLDTLITNIGGTKQSMARDLVQAINSVVDWLNTLDSQTLGLISTIAGIAGATLIAIGGLGLLGGAFLNIYQTGIILADLFPALAAGVGAVTKALGAMFAVLSRNPFTIILTIIALLVAAFITLYNNSETFRNAVQPLFERLSQLMVQLQPIIEQVVQVLVNLFTTMMAGAESGGASLLDILSQVATILLGIFSSALQAVLPPILSLVQTMAGILLPVLQALMPLLSAIGAIFTALATGDLASLSGLIENMGTAFEGFIGALATAIPQIMQVITSLITTLISMAPAIIEAGIQMFVGLVQAIATVLPMIITAAIGLIMAVIQAVVGMLPTLIEAFVSGFTSLVGALTTILPMLIQAVLQLVLALVQAIVTMIPLLIQAGIQLFLGLLQGLVAALPQIITALVGAIPQIITAIVGAIPLIIDAAIQLFLGVVTGLLAALPLIITALVTALPQVIQAIMDAIPLIINAAIELFLAIIIGLLEALPQIIIALVSALPQIIVELVKAIPLIIQAAIQLFIGIITGLMEALPQIITALVDAIPQMVDALVSASPQFVNAGVQLIQGLIRGIQSMIGNLWNAAMEAVSGLLGSVKSALGIASPSKEFYEIGFFVMAGMINAISDMKGRAVAAVVSVAESMADVPFDLSNIQAAYDSLDAVKSVQVKASTSLSASLDSQMASQSKLLAKINNSLEKLKQETHYTTTVNNPVPEKASVSVPRAIRAVAYVNG